MPTGNTKNSDSRRSCTSLRCGTLFHRPNALCTPLPEILSLLRCSYHLPVYTNHTVQQDFLIIICDFTGFVNEFFVAEGFSLYGLLFQYPAPCLRKCGIKPSGVFGVVCFVSTVPAAAVFRRTGQLSPRHHFAMRSDRLQLPQELPPAG